MRSSALQQPRVLPRAQIPVLSTPADRFSSVSAALEALTARLESGTTPRYAATAKRVAELLRRPGKRIRPYLFLVGYEAATRGPRPAGVANFAAALELLHVFLLIHDDIADRADSRRGAPALHVMLRPGSCFVEGVESPYSLMAASKGVYGEAVGEWTPQDALGFSKI